MLKFVLCATLFVLGTEAAGVQVKPCHWKDHECIVKSAALLLPYYIKGIQEFGVVPSDPLTIDKVNADNGQLELTFNDLKIEGLSKCNIVDIQRPTPDSKINIVLECPILLTGHYKAGGKLFTLDVSGDGATKINTDKIHIDLILTLKTIEKDGKKYYKFSAFDYKYQFLEKVYFKFENLFNGDKTKAEPIEKLLDESWKEIVPLGAPLVKAVVSSMVRNVEKVFLAIPKDQIELPA